MTGATQWNQARPSVRSVAQEPCSFSASPPRPGLRVARRSLQGLEEEKPHKARKKGLGERLRVEGLGRPVLATNTDDGIRAARGNGPVDPAGVGRCLEDRFG